MLEISIIFAKFFGGFFIIMGLLSLGPKFLGKTIKRTDDKLFIVSTGYISLLLGLTTVVLHNFWVADWTVIITILGWSTLIKGILKTGFPEHIQKQAQMFKNKQSISSVFLLLLGLALLWLGLTA